jgi:hypothetical protein
VEEGGGLERSFVHRTTKTRTEEQEAVNSNSILFDAFEPQGTAPQWGIALFDSANTIPEFIV